MSRMRTAIVPPLLAIVFAALLSSIALLISGEGFFSLLQGPISWILVGLIVATTGLPTFKKLLLRRKAKLTAIAPKG